MDDSIRFDPRLLTTARDAGLTVTPSGREIGGEFMFGITVERPESAGGWSMAPTEIAISRDPETARRTALEAIRKMAPQIQAKLDAASPEPPETRIAAGISGDGTVTALRVERDGTVRLSPEDIDLIAEAVYARAFGEPRRLLGWRVGETRPIDDGHLPESDLTWLPDGTIGPKPKP